MKFVNHNSPEKALLKYVFKSLSYMDVWICSIIEGYIYEKVEKINYIGYREEYTERYRKREGEYKEWYKDGSKKTIKNYKDGEQFGLLEGWHIDGTPSVYASFNEKGMFNGVCKGWYENGNPMYEIYYQNGEEQGTRIDYYTNGKPRMLRNYINGLQVGEYKYWNEDGTLSTYGIYNDNGNLIKLKQYNNNGKLYLEKTLIENDISEDKGYYSSGKLQYIKMLKGNKRDGEYTSYWDCDEVKLWVRATYKNNVLDGEYEERNKDGTLKEKCCYKDGEKQV